MAKLKGQQIAIFVIVGAFIFSSLALSGIVIWEMAKGDKTSSDQADTAAIQQQLQEQLQAQQSNQEGAKLETTDIQVGTGAEAVDGKNVTVHYTGTLKSDGSKFDSSLDRGEPFSFVLGTGQVIQGWDQGVAGMKVGGKRKLVIPAALAYGEQSPSPAIPPNSDLVFEVELLGVE